MFYYRCKCGKSESWGSMPPRRCDGCPYCGVTLASYPGGHTKPDKHKLITEYDTHTGKPYRICRVCHQTLSQIRKEKMEAKNETSRQKS